MCRHDRPCQSSHNIYIIFFNGGGGTIGRVSHHIYFLFVLGGRHDRPCQSSHNIYFLFSMGEARSAVSLHNIYFVFSMGEARSAVSLHNIYFLFSMGEARSAVSLIYGDTIGRVTHDPPCQVRRIVTRSGSTIRRVKVTIRRSKAASHIGSGVELSISSVMYVYNLI